jgi:hypothetical protein
LGKKLVYTALAFVLFAGPARAFSITNTDNANTLAAAFLLPGSGITITGASLNYSIPVTVTAGAYPTGTYVQGPLGIGDGIIVTNGLATNALPPDISASTSYDLGLPGNTIVDQIVGMPVASLDTIILTLNFNVDAWVNSIAFDFIFGSEEYPEYVGSQYDDAFGVFLNGNLRTNQIVFDSTGNPVTINSPFFYSTNVQIPPANGMGYNGSTSMLTTKAAVTPGSTNNTILIVISDVKDAIYDSGALLSHFRGSGEIVVTPVTEKLTPTPTYTVTQTNTDSPTATISPSWTMSETYTITQTHTATPTMTETYTVTETHTATSTFTITDTVTPTYTVTETSTDTYTSTVTPTFTVTMTATNTPVPFVMDLKGNFPNPFSGRTNIVYWLSRDAKVDVKIWTVSGEVVRHDQDIDGKTGYNTFVWDGINRAGREVSSGVYIYKIHAKAVVYGDEAAFVRKMGCVR